MFPVVNTVAAVCKVNGDNVPCPDPFGFIFAMFVGIWIFLLVVFIILVVAKWKIFTKAGRSGWISIISIYDLVIMLEMVGKPKWWVILFFIPFVNIVVGYILLHEIAKAFGKDIGFTLGMIFLPFIFFPILAFGKSTFQGVPSSDPVNPPPTPPQTPPQPPSAPIQTFNTPPQAGV